MTVSGAPSSRPPRKGAWRVEFYAGHRSGETPRILIWRGRRLEIGSMRRRSRVLNKALGLIKDVFDTFAAPNPDFQIGVKSAAQYQP